MAKKKTVQEDFEGGIDSLFSMVKSIDDSAEIIADSYYSNIQEWVPSGNYILNATMSGDLFKALPSGRIISLVGKSGVGKSYLACSFAREAQYMGYIPIVLDSEGAYDADFVKRIKVDPTKLIIKKVNTILETSQFIANVCNKLEEQQNKTGHHDKVLFILDSLGNLTSEKEREDTLSGSSKADFTKAKDAKAMFRVIATPIAKLQCIMICCNHVYDSMSFIPQSIQAQGCLVPDEEILVTVPTEHNMTLYENKKMKDIVPGDYVMGYDGLRHEVLQVHNLKKPTYTFNFDNGSKIECSNIHRFLVNIEHPELDSSWKTADELNEGDEIYIIENQ